jgi:hypothetical protein
VQKSSLSNLDISSSSLKKLPEATETTKFCLTSQSLTDASCQAINTITDRSYKGTIYNTITINSTQSCQRIELNRHYALNTSYYTKHWQNRAKNWRKLKKSEEDGDRVSHALKDFIFVPNQWNQNSSNIAALHISFNLISKVVNEFTAMSGIAFFGELYIVETKSNKILKRIKVKNFNFKLGISGILEKGFLGFLKDKETNERLLFYMFYSYHQKKNCIQMTSFLTGLPFDMEDNPIFSERRFDEIYEEYLKDKEKVEHSDERVKKVNNEYRFRNCVVGMTTSNGQLFFIAKNEKRTKFFGVLLELTKRRLSILKFFEIHGNEENFKFILDFKAQGDNLQFTCLEKKQKTIIRKYTLQESSMIIEEFDIGQVLREKDNLGAINEHIGAEVNPEQLSLFDVKVDLKNGWVACIWHLDLGNESGEIEVLFQVLNVC